MITTKNNTLEELQDICYKSLLSILTNMGLKDGMSSETNQIKITLNIIDKYERFLEECIRSLIEYNYIQPNESTLTIPKDIQNELINFNWQEKLREIILETPKLKNHSKLLEECLKRLKDILQGEVRATDVLFPDGSMELVSGVYSENEEANYFNDILCQVVGSIVSESIENLQVGEKFTILEIGAGTGGTSNLLFETLKPYKDQISYVYTDISKSFLLHAEKSFKTIAPYLETAIFNIEKSPELQKIPLGNFDMVIGANVVHATKNIQKSLKNIKETLKTNGVLILNEIAQNHISSTLTFGLLDGWWLYEDVEVRMKGSPGLALEGWQKVLTDTGFTNTIKYPEDEELTQQIIISQSDGEIIRIDDDIKKSDYTKEKETNTSKKTFKTHIEDTVISEGINITEIKNFIKIKLAFVLKMEISELDEDTPMLDYGVDSILGLELIKEINDGLSDTIPTTILFDYPTIKELANYLAEEYTTDFIVQKEESESKTPQQPKIVKKEVVSTSIDNEKGQAKRLWIEQPSTIDDIKLVNFNLPAIKQDEVLVETSHFSLNFGDLLCVKGLYPTMPPYPFSPGFEASGTIIKKGNTVNNFKLGDKVIVMADGNYGLHSTHCIANKSQLLPIPKNQSFEEACAIPIVAITTVESFRRIRVKKGDYILIQTATGGIGQMAVQLSKHFKLNIIATAGSNRKVDYLKQNGVPFAINYRELDFEEEVNKITNGKGVKVVINTLSGENIQKGINCLGKGGQYVELSMTALKSANQIDLSKLSSNQTFIAVNLREFIDEDRAYLEGLWDECKQYIEKGILKPVISTEIPLENYKEAYKILEDRENVGKVIVKTNSTKIPQVEIVNNNFRVNKLLNEVSSKTLDIAVVGMSGQYGNTKDLNDFWEKLELGKSLIEEIPKDRWDINEHFSTDQKAFNKTYSKWGSFLRDIDKFDPLFFRISGKEAEGMDPQQRFFLQHCWKALEDAAIIPDQLNGKKCGVYVGASQGDYVQTNNFENAAVYWGNSSAILASRIAYLINLQGPAIAIDTACSSSLVALDMACKNLYHKEIDVAISGGVFIGITPRFYKLSSMANMLSKDGKCYTFDERANGFVPGEGVGVLILKRLEDAKRDGDFIHAVIKGTGSNQDGTTNGILAPSMKSQARLESEVYEEYGIHPETITYVEAHGTGTKLGDPIEFEGLTRAFKKKTDKTNYCGLGSVKTNIGHTVYAAGVAGVQKVILAIKNKKIPPTLNYENKNSLIDIKNSPFYIVNKLSKWGTTNSEPRRAAVSSFGFSGTNAHVVIEEYKGNNKGSYFSKEFIVPISAKSNEALNLQIEQLVDYLEKNPEITIADVAYTLQVGRQPMEYRVAYIVNSTKDLLTKLRDQKSSVRNHSIATEEKEQFKTFLSNRSGEVYIKHAIENNELKSLANLWIMGVETDWNKLYKDDLQKPKRISLPTYPFEKNRFWLDAGRINLSIEKNNQRTSNERQEDIDKIEEFQNGTLKELIINKVHVLVAGLLGIRKSKIDIKKELSMYGITSITLAELNSKLNTYYEVSLLPSTFYNYKTIESLVEYLLEEHSSAVIKKHKKKDEEIRLKEDVSTVPKAVKLSLSQIDTMYPQNTIEDSNYLIQYHELMKDKPNIFIIPGVPGVAYGYYELAEQFYQYGNCFGITMQGIFDGKKPLNSIEKMAAHNIEEIKKVIQPNTEISLVAHSFGGLLSYEMIKQLKESSIKVRQIFMLDCFTNTLSVGNLEKMILFLRLFPEISDTIEPDTLNKEIQQILQVKKKSKEKLLYDFITKNGVMIDQKTFINLWNVLDISMSCTYEMDIQYDVPVTLAKVKDQVVSNELEDLGWGQYFEHVKVVDAEGDHFSIIRKPHCSELMKKITFEESQLIK